MYRSVNNICVWIVSIESDAGYTGNNHSQPDSPVSSPAALRPPSVHEFSSSQDLED